MARLRDWRIGLLAVASALSALWLFGPRSPPPSTGSDPSRLRPVALRVDAREVDAAGTVSEAPSAWSAVAPRAASSAATASSAAGTTVISSPRAYSAAVEVPYRFVGRWTQDGENQIVLFGQGRTATLSRPGPLDDEYAVEALFDDYLVIRHLPSGAGRFLALERRQPLPAALMDPEAFPHD